MNLQSVSKMEKLAAKIPEACRSEWEEIANFNFMAAYNPDMKAQVNEYKEHKLMPTFPSEGIAYAFDNWTPRKGDVLVASFPRTGTNWTTEIVRQILFCHDEELMEMSKNIPLLFMLYEGGGPSKFRVMNHLPFPRSFFASHLPSSLINVNRFKEVGAKILCLIRNPKDQAYSWYNFAPKLPYMQLDPMKSIVCRDWPEFFENYISGEIPMGLRHGEWYLDYLKSWHPHVDEKTVMFLCFEEMKKDLPNEIRRIASFIDVQLSEKNVLKIAENCGFSQMKKSTEEAKSFSDKTRKDIQVLHKGEVGEWKNHFTVAQSELVDRQVEEKLKDTGIKFTY